MTTLPDTTVKTEPLSQVVRNYIEANLHKLQQKRIDTLNNVTLDDVFEGRNPYLLRATEGSALDLITRYVVSYLASTDEIYFANFLKDVAEFTARFCGKNMTITENDYRQFYGQEFWQFISGSPTLYLDIIEPFAMRALPLQIELLTEHDRNSNRLTRQFYQHLCNDDGSINWERLTRFISESAKTQQG